MIRRLATPLLTVMLGSVVNFIGHAQSLPSLTHHVREEVLNGKARFVGRLPAEQPMRLVVVLPLRNQPALDQFLRDLYDPASPSYRHYLTVEEFTTLFGPTQHDYDTVLRWAGTNGLTVVGTSRNRLNVDVSAPVAAIETAFHIKLGLYQHPTENRTFYAPDREPSADLPFQLWRVAGLDNFSIPHSALVRKPQSAASQATPQATTGSCPDQSFCGSDMRAAYYGGTLTGAGQSLGLLEFAGTDLDDLTTYFTNAGQTNTVPITLVSTDGTDTSCTAANGCDDTEQTLDMTQAIGMAPGLSSLVMYIGSSDPALLNGMATASPLNPQLSSSWIWSPGDPATDDPYFQEFAAQGQNFFQAAGDGGKWTSTELYPSDEVYVTTVGGTDLETTGAGGAWSSESAWVDGGGGISPGKIAIPFWQTTTASGCSKCSTSYRNGPDVSANSNFTFYVCADQTTCTANLYGGTSFAAPMWAGYLALVNQKAASEGKPPLGFINPALYTIGLSSSYDTDFHDISTGSNGFAATTGYDLATGWGSPNGSGLISGLIGTIKTPGFGLTASVPALSLVQGTSGTSTITSTVLNGFNSVISLSATGQPAGVAVTFSPTSITGAGTSTITVKVGATAAVGTYEIRVKGTSGSIVEVVTISLSVTKGQPNYTISASPTSITVPIGSSGKVTITSAIFYGWDSAISLSATGYPIGVSIDLSPATIPAPGSGKSTMEVIVGHGVAKGKHTITINAMGAGVPREVQVTLVVK